MQLGRIARIEDAVGEVALQTWISAQMRPTDTSSSSVFLILPLITAALRLN